jgi:alanyl-tRNA synthetase
MKKALTTLWRSKQRSFSQKPCWLNLKWLQGLESSGVWQQPFWGYEHLSLDQATVQAIYKDGTLVDELKSGEDGVVVLDRTPFYAEAGGQVGDKGELGNQTALFQVDDTMKIQADVFGHQGSLLEGSLKVGDVTKPKVDQSARVSITRNHVSATHLMREAVPRSIQELMFNKKAL